MGTRNVQVGSTVRVYFNIPLQDASGPALVEAGGQPQASVNGAAYDVYGIGPLVAVGYGEYYAVLGATLTLADGDRIFTRYKGASTAEVSGDDFVVGTAPTDPVSVSHYGTVQNADLFFSFFLNSRKWDTSSPATKQKALIAATRLVDRLNYSGDKTYAGQVLQFPRSNSYTDPLTQQTTSTGDDVVPTDIKLATYVIALRLLEGYDPDKEGDLLAVNSVKYGQVGTAYTRDFLPEHMRAGIPSYTAWGYLRPYLRDPNEMTLTRI